MSLTNGQAQVLYILLSTRSQTRFSIEGIFGQTFGSAGPGDVVSLSDLNTRLDQQLARIFPGNNKTHADLNNPSLLLPLTAGDNSHGVTTDQRRIRTAVGMDTLYDPVSDPCPGDFSTVSHTAVQVNDEAKIIAGILSKIP